MISCSTRSNSDRHAEQSCPTTESELTPNHYVQSSELAPRIDAVHSPVRKSLVQFVLQGDGVLGEEQRVRVIEEWHRRVTEFTHSIARFEAPGHSDFDDVRAQGTDVRDDIDVTGTNVRRPVV